MEEYNPYKKIVLQLGLKSGDCVYLSSDVMKLAFYSSIHGEIFDLNKLINSFQKVITLKGTLMIPTFNFDFSNHGVYDYSNTPSATGALGNAALKRDDFLRTLHPMHSFAVWGKDQKLLCSMNNCNSFGEDSPFGYMHCKNVTQIMIGADYQKCMTFVHYVEKKANVPYRFNKKFTGDYTDADGNTDKRTYEYPARYLELGSVEKFNRIGVILEQKKISSKYFLNDIPIYKVLLGDSYDTIYTDAVYNKCKNLYDFNCNRDDIWKK